MQTKGVGSDFREVSGSIREAANNDFKVRYDDLKKRAWAQILRSTLLTDKLSNQARRKVEASSQEIYNLEFNAANIHGFLSGVAQSLGDIYQEMILMLFDSIIERSSDNAVFYKSWKSNQKHRIGMRLRKTRFILPRFRVGFSKNLDYEDERFLADIDKAFHYLHGGVGEFDGLVQACRKNPLGTGGDGIWSNSDGDLRLTPIFSFSTDDVWETLGYAAAGLLESYSDFSEVIEFYRDAGGGCVVLSADAVRGSSTPCSTRSGCWSCTRAGKTDRSAEQLVESNPTKYGQLKPLNRLRTYLVNIQYDWSLRNHLGRTIAKDGHIEVVADAFTPETLRKLLIYTLTAERLSGVPIISAAQLILIDAKWSASAFFPPFTAIKTYFDVVDRRMYEQAPEVPYMPPSPVPRVGRIFVGEDWYQVTGINSMAGMRDPLMELHHESCDIKLKALKNGALVCDYEEGRKLAVDEDGAMDFLAFLAEDYIRDYCRDDNPDWTEGYRIYQRLGILTNGLGHSRMMDEILRRSQWLQSKDLHGQRSVDELKARCTVLYESQAALFDCV